MFDMYVYMQCITRVLHFVISDDCQTKQRPNTKHTQCNNKADYGNTVRISSAESADQTGVKAATSFYLLR